VTNRERKGARKAKEENLKTSSYRKEKRAILKKYISSRLVGLNDCTERGMGAQRG
jgi:hypothetical protein